MTAIACVISGAGSAAGAADSRRRCRKSARTRVRPDEQHAVDLVDTECLQLRLDLRAHLRVGEDLLVVRGGRRRHEHDRVRRHAAREQRLHRCEGVDRRAVHSNLVALLYQGDLTVA